MAADLVYDRAGRRVELTATVSGAVARPGSWSDPSPTVLGAPIDECTYLPVGDTRQRVLVTATQSDALTGERPFENRFLQAARAEAIPGLVHLEADVGQRLCESPVGDPP